MRTFQDKQLANLRPLMGNVQEESERQIKKWGVQERSLFEWMCYLTEEVGELAEAISEHHYRDGSANDIRKEAIQVATLSLKIAEMIEPEVIDDYGENVGRW